jgi:hypothetical protein
VTVNGWLAVSNLDSVACTQRVVSPGTFDFGQLSSGTSSPPHTFAVTNTGTDPMTSIDTTLAGSGYGSYSLSNNTCPATLEMGQACSVDVTFNATSLGTFTPKLIVTSSAAGGASNLSGESVMALNPNPAQGNFGSLAAGEPSAPQHFALTNTTGSTITGIDLQAAGSGKGYFPISNNTCAGSLTAGSSCGFDVTFAPTAAGSWHPTITATSSVDPTVIKLQGTGLAALEATPTSKAYGTVPVGTDSPAQTFTLKNNTSSSVTTLAVAMAGSGNGNYVISNNTCASTLASGAECQFDVTFHPLGVGTFTPRVAVTSSLPTLNLNVSGTGRNSLEVDPASKDFGNQAINTTSAPQTFTVTNTTSSDISGIAVTKAGSGIGTMLIGDDQCTGQTLAPGASCTFQISFRPNKAGVFKPTISVTSSAPTTVVKVQGTGV